MSYSIHTIESAPEGSKPVLRGIQKAFGFIPNLSGVLAFLAPVLLFAQTPERAEDVHLLAIGKSVPDVIVNLPDGTPATMADLTRDHISVLIFYRGGWCPYCNTHLADLRRAVEPLQALGARLIAISPDRPELLAEAAAQADLGYALVSDAAMEAARAFGIAFTVDTATRDVYRGYGIDLEASSGRDHHQLPVPAVFVIDRSGRIAFVHADPDYKKRLSADVVLAVVKHLD